MSRFPLTDAFPGVAGIERIELCTLPTPLDSGAAMLSVGGVGAGSATASPASLRVKRDDLTSRLYGGNKTRKLEFLLGDALAQNRRAVITFGAYGSNHALATAVHARALGLEPHVVLSPQVPGPFAARTLRAHAGLGTGLHVVEGWSGLRTAVELKHELTERDGIEPAVVPMGGTNALGALGYVNAALEVVAQARKDGSPVPDVVYVAAGTLGTAMGLAIGFAAADVPTRVVAVRVTPEELAADTVARTLAADTVALLRTYDAGFPTLTFDDIRFELEHEWFEPGYGIVTLVTTEAVAVAAGDDIALETTYTGKAFAALLGDADYGRLAGEHAVFWNTYNSAPLPPAGDDADLPPVLRTYVEECDWVFGSKE
jgi:1-aminocyclopropane-1-carboxylate deaminase/D-cysteine desulfhydrase-like pyridoxal-dependent ACC family enzyme